MRWAKQHGASDIVLGGASMGGSIVASYLRHSPDADEVQSVVLDSPMLNFRDTIAYGARDVRIPPGLSLPSTLTWSAEELASLRYDVDWRATDYTSKPDWVRGPVLIVHGTRDDTVPISTSRDCSRTTSARCSWWRCAVPTTSSPGTSTPTPTTGPSRSSSSGRSADRSGAPDMPALDRARHRVAAGVRGVRAHLTAEGQHAGQPADRHRPEHGHQQGRGLVGGQVSGIRGEPAVACWRKASGARKATTASPTRTIRPPCSMKTRASTASPTGLARQSSTPGASVRETFGQQRPPAERVDDAPTRLPDLPPEQTAREAATPTTADTSRSAPDAAVPGGVRQRRHPGQAHQPGAGADRGAQRRRALTPEHACIARDRWIVRLACSSSGTAARSSSVYGRASSPTSHVA